MMKNIEVIDPIEILPPNRLAIWLCNVEYSIIKNRCSYVYLSKEIVLKGSEDRIKNDLISKQRILTAHLEGANNIKKKVIEFDYNKMEIINVQFLKLLGYGIS